MTKRTRVFIHTEDAGHFAGTLGMLNLPGGIGNLLTVEIANMVALHETSLPVRLELVEMTDAEVAALREL